MIRIISVTELQRLGYNINLIDIRSVAKYNDNHIMQARNIPKEIFVKEYYKYLDKNKTYYIYCQQGTQSIGVCRLLTKLGYNVYNVLGGYESWILNN